MINRLSGQSDNLSEASLLNVGTQQGAEKIGENASTRPQDASAAALLDEASISDEARQTYEAEKEALRFSRLAQRGKETVDTDKISHFQQLLNSGRIHEYLGSLDADTLAGSLLNSPSGKFLGAAQGF